ncbi:MAG: glycosyltransferase family 2 protein [Holosporales bacterium]|jgi:glycosyltransferase involved in cell wall biosynthesis|nr:glycosyltransferase family 2 protein [Holosporales bacterium]
MTVELSVVIPFFNEEGAVTKLHSDLSAALSATERIYELVLVDDGSQDNTPHLLDELAQSDTHVVVVHLAMNYGQTTAMVAGIDHAQGEIIVTMDGDGQNDPKSILNLLKKLEEGYDVVSGWRQNRCDSFLSRKLPSLIANRLISYISGVKLNDYGCSLKAYRRSVLENVQLYGEMHRFVPIYAHLAGARVTEIPVNHFPRLTGKSKYGISRTVKVLLDLIVVKFLQRYLTKPIYVMGGFGLLCLCVGGSAFTLATYLKLFEGTPYISTPLPLLSVVSVLFGGISILIGLIGEIVMRTYYESQGKRTYVLRLQVQGKKVAKRRR